MIHIMLCSFLTNFYLFKIPTLPAAVGQLIAVFGSASMQSTIGKYMCICTFIIHCPSCLNTKRKLQCWAKFMTKNN